MSCIYFNWISEHEANCKGQYYPEEIIDPSHFYEHCRDNNSRNCTDCRYYPTKTDYKRCYYCKTILLDKNEIYCNNCGEKQDINL